MDPISPLVSEAYRLLQSDLYRHLDEVEFVAGQCDDWSEDDAWAAHELMEDLVIVVRTLVVEHRAGESGGCDTCASAWPCPVLATIHRTVKDPEHHFVELVRKADHAMLTSRW